MIYGTGLLALVELGLLVYCVLHIITTPEQQVRNLPKLLWLLLVVVLPIVGSIAWLVAGRPKAPPAALRARGDRGLPPARPRRTTPTPPDDDEAFLRSLRERAEQQRRAERERRAAEGEDPRSPTG